ncbi:MAG: 3-isopropylmalate dehydratase small subunit [bacterium]
MDAFDDLTGVVVPFDHLNVDTDQIIPKQFLKRVERTGFGEYLFYDWRYEDNGDPDPDFILNQEPYDEAEIMLCRENFGCGSSREHAPWALKDFGIKTLISPSFADIFHNNCFKNGMLPIELDAEIVDDLFDRVEAADHYEMTVDLEAQHLSGSDGWEQDFEIDSFNKKCLMEGLDEIALTLKDQDVIQDFEQSENAPRSLDHGEKAKAQ